MFSDLFRFRDRQTKTPLEDFSTEALKAVLNAMPEPTEVELIGWLVKKTGASFSDTTELGHLEWRSQVSLSGSLSGLGFVDLVLYQNGNPVFAFENKIGADFHKDQLERYGNWILKNKTVGNLPPCFFVITHHTGVPDDFEQSTDRYGVQNRAVLRWSEVLNQLRKVAQVSNSEAFEFLIDSFGEFLEEQGMAHEFPTNEDLAVLHGFIPHYDRIESLIDSMWDRVRPHFTAQIPKATAYSFMNSENGTWWKYAYCQKRAGSKSDHISVGVRYPDVSIDWGSNVSEPHVFLLLDDDNDELPVDTYSSPGKEWEITDTNLMALKPLSEFSADPEQRGEQILNWVESRAKELSTAMDNRETS